MILYPRDIERKMRQRHIGEDIIRRVLRLNPNGMKEGSRPRGFFRKSLHQSLVDFSMGFYPVGKRAFIAKLGREAWDALPNCYKAKSGRRRAVDVKTVEDNVHLMYTQPEFCRCIKKPLNNRYANDPSVAYEWVENPDYIPQRFR